MSNVGHTTCQLNFKPRVCQIDSCRPTLLLPGAVWLQVLELESMPKVVTLVGGGYIGMEFAGMFARLGCEVHVIARQELPLAPRFDKEVRDTAALFGSKSVVVALVCQHTGHTAGTAWEQAY